MNLKSLVAGAFLVLVGQTFANASIILTSTAEQQLGGGNTFATVTVRVFVESTSTDNLGYYAFKAQVAQSNLTIVTATKETLLGPGTSFMATFDPTIDNLNRTVSFKGGGQGGGFDLNHIM